MQPVMSPSQPDETTERCSAESIRKKEKRIYFSLFSLCFISSQSHSGHLEPGHLLKTSQTPPAPFSLALAARHIASWPRSRRPSMFPSVTACLFIQLELFFETLVSRLLWVCVCQRVRPLHTLPLPSLFQLFLL